MKYDIVLELEDLITIDHEGNITVDKDIFDDYVKDSVIKIKWVETSMVLEYKMVSETDESIYMEAFY